MPGTLKLPTISSVCHSLKLHHSAAGSRSLRHPVSAAGWWLCRRAHAKPPHCISSLNPIPPCAHHRLMQSVGFRGQEFLRLSSSSSASSSSASSSSYNCHRKRRGYYCNFNSSGIATPMGPTPSGHDGKKPTSPSHPDKLLTLPTILTIGRVAAVPLLVTAFYVDTWWSPNVTTGIFIAAAITDWLDGYLARKMKQGTAFGAFLDPVADKLMVAAALVLLCTKPLQAGIFVQAPWLLTVPAIAIIGREITMSAVREWAASQDGKLSEAVAVNNLGKWKTATQMTALTILLATRDSSLVGSGTLVASGVVLLYMSAWLSIWSLFVYMQKIWKVLMM